MTYTELRETLSKNLKRLRKDNNLTQEKLAEKVELSTQTIADIEGCRTWVSDKTLVKIAEILKTTPAELLATEKTDFEITSDMKKMILAKIDESLTCFV